MAAKTRHGRIYWSGSAWVASQDGLHPTDTVTMSWDNTNTLTVTHGWLPGQDLTLVPDTREGLVTTPFLPVSELVDTNGTSFQVQFITEGGAGPGFGLRTGAAGSVAPGSGMSFRWTKTYNGPLYFDGTNGFDQIPWDDADAGNLWVLGFMKRP